MAKRPKIRKMVINSGNSVKVLQRYFCNTYKREELEFLLNFKTVHYSN